MEDRRKFPRIKSRFDIAYYPENDPTQFSYAVSKNISMGGLCMRAHSSIIENFNILKMELSCGKEDIVTATGRVAWKKAVKLTPLSDVEVGIEFINVPHSDIARCIEKNRKNLFLK